jgi:glycolate oxidase iron-sulfur subunit
MSGVAINSALPLDARTYQQAQQCVHCGLCLPVCPTYLTNGLETDSPRGRIYLMKAMAEGRIQPSEPVLDHLDLCLDCRACETACPSAVQYHELIEAARARFSPGRARNLSQRIVDGVARFIFPYPIRVKLTMLPARLLQKVGLFGVLSNLAARCLGPGVAKMNDMLPPRGPLWERNLAPFHPATGPKRATVGFFAGCVGSVVFQHVNRKTIQLLQHLGCEVVVPMSQACCGAMHHHNGYPGPAADFARRNLDAFDGVDVVINNIAGCGAMLKEYDHLLRDDPKWAARAAAFTRKTRDISQFLAELNPPPPPPAHRVEQTAVYHDACHLAHGQKITAQPRALLARVPGLKLIPLVESDTCCGAAGTYNLQQPQMARALAERKLAHIRASGAKLCITGNVGCAMQIASEARRAGMELNVLHPVEVLHRAYLGSR